MDAEEYGRWLLQYVHLNPVRPRKREELIPKERRRAREGAKEWWERVRGWCRRGR